MASVARPPLSRRRHILVWTLIVLAALLGLVSTLTTWVQRQMLDSNGWKHATTQVVQSPEVQAALSTYLVNQVYNNAGVAFAGSGYIACQLKHLAIVATIVWLPVALALLDRALERGPRTTPRRLVLLGGFGLVFAQQALAGFPQSAYICGLVYAPFVLFRAVEHRTELGRQLPWLLGGAALAALLGAAASLVEVELAVGILAGLGATALLTSTSGLETRQEVVARSKWALERARQMAAPAQAHA